MLNFLLLAVCVLLVLGIIMVGLFSLIVIIESIMDPDHLDNDFWKDS